MRLALRASLALFFAASLALAADVTGTWKGQINTPNGDKFDLTYSFKQDGEKLTGTTTGPQGDPIQISDAKVTGDQVTFSINVPMNGGMKIAHTGKIVSESQIEMKMDMGEQMSQTFTVKKQ
jgi:hypothetical protein